MLGIALRLVQRSCGICGLGSPYRRWRYGRRCRLLPCGQYAGSGGAIGVANTRHWRGYVLGPLALARIRRAQARPRAGRSSCRAHERFDIGFGRRDGGNFELLDEEIEDIGRNERRKRRPDADVFDAEVE